MGFFSVLLMFICLCADNMVMANMSAMKPENEKNRNTLSLKIALMFSVFHIIFLILGYFAAYLLTSVWGDYSWLAKVWISFAFVMLIGIRLLVETVEKSPSFSIHDSDMNSKLINTSILLGLNSMLIGFAIQIMNQSYHFFWALVSLFVISLIMSMIGFFMGRPDAKKIPSKVVECFAGGLMIILAVRILIIYY